MNPINNPDLTPYTNNKTSLPEDVHGTLFPRTKPENKSYELNIFNSMETMWNVAKKQTSAD